LRAKEKLKEKMVVGALSRLGNCGAGGLEAFGASLGWKAFMETVGWNDTRPHSQVSGEVYHLVSKETYVAVKRSVENGMMEMLEGRMLREPAAGRDD
jgi:hypothetical protein